MAKVLVVDDYAENRELLVVLLRYAGHEPYEAGDGAEALAMVREHLPELVICDILMPTMDGYEFVRRLRADPLIEHTEVVFYTATFLEREATNLAESCGVRHVLTKPCEPEQILRMVDSALSRVAGPPQPSNPMPSDSGMFDREHLRLMTDKLVQKAAELESANQRLSALTDLNLQLASERDPLVLLDKFCHGARDLFAARCAILMVRDKNAVSTTHLASWGIAATDIDRLRDVPIDQGVFGRVLAERAPRRINGPHIDRGVLGLGDQFPELQSGLIAPVLSLHNAYGWIFLVDKIGFDRFSEEDARLLTIHAAQAGRIYENGSLYAKVQRHANHLETAQRQSSVQYAVASILADAQSWRDAIAECFAAIAQHLQFSVGVLLEIDAAGSACCAAAWSSGKPALAEFVAQLPEARFDGSLGPPGRVWRTGESYATADVAAEPDFAHCPQLGNARLRAAVFVPVVSHGTKIGVLELFAEEAYEPNADVVQTLSAIGGQIGQFMVRERQQLNIRRLNRVYAVLSGVNSLIVRVRDRAELFREACRIAVEEGRFRKAWIGVLNADPPRLDLAECAGDDSAYFEKLRGVLFSLTEAQYGPSVEKLRAGQPLVFNDVAEDPTVFLKSDLLAGGSRAVVWLPLIVAESLAGVLVLHADEKEFFDADEMKLLLELASDIAFALEHIAKTDRLDYLAYFDVLTELANATHFSERLDRRLVAAGRNHERLAVVVVNVSRFKVINNAFGRQIGDGMLKQVAVRIASCADDTSHVARLGADNFALMLPAFEHENALASFVEERVLGCFRQPFHVDGMELHCAGKVGMALFPEDGSDAASLLRNAESTLGQVKNSGEPYLFYTKQMGEKVAEALALESDLRRALENDEFVLHYQPKVDINDRHLEGIEALIRWNSPQFGLVPPMQFIPLLEETGLIVEVGAWIWKRAALDYLAWMNQGLIAPRIAVNVSAVQLRRNDFVATIATFLKNAAEPVEIDIEVTESTAMEDIDDSINKLHDLYALGVNIAIDDFGTGHSSLSYLAKLPAHFLKIDRSFICAMLEDPDKMSVVSTIISLAHALRLKVVAEGVDTREQANMLRLLRCDQMQGYLIAKPMPFEQMTGFIRDRSERGEDRSGWSDVRS